MIINRGVRQRHQVWQVRRGDVSLPGTASAETKTVKFCNAKLLD
jgi:hypothetical protein